MSGQKRDGFDLDANELEERRTLAKVVESAPTISAFDIADAIIAAGWVSPAAVAERGGEPVVHVETLRAAVRDRNYAMRQRDEERAAKEGNWAALNGQAAELAEANRRLGEVAAVLNDGTIHATKIRERALAVLAPVSGAVEGAALVGDMDAAVEAGAAAIYRLTYPGSDWTVQTEPMRRGFLAAAREAIAAGTPYLPSPAAPVAGHEQEVRAEDDGERERWHAVADDIMKHFRSIGSNVSDTYVGLVMSEAWKRRGALSVSAAGHKQEVRGEAIDRFVDAHRKSIDYLLRSADDPVYEDDVAAANHLRSRAGGMSYVVDALVALTARSSGSSAPVQGDEA